MGYQQIKDVRFQSIGMKTDITGAEVEYFKMGAKNKAGYVQISESVPACDFNRVLTELQEYANGAQIPPHAGMFSA